MTFTELTDLETLELAFAIWSAGDAPDLDAAAALAFDEHDSRDGLHR